MHVDGKGAMAGEHELRAVNVRVHGTVQGVGYRFGAMRQAAKLDIAGWIRNDGSGTVSAHLEGLGYRLDSMIDWMRQGPAAATVTRVDVEGSKVQGLDDFTLG